MNYKDWIDVIISILSGLAVTIPLVISLIKTISDAAKEKNWSKIVDITLNYMQKAEQNIDNGASRKAWVISMVRESAVMINYDFNNEAEQKLSMLIDSICAATKHIN